LQHVHGTNDRQGHVPFIVAHGTDVEVTEGPKGECNMAMGQMTDRTMGHSLWPMGQMLKHHKVPRAIAICL
jgi:hypothetical protein